MFGYQPIYKMGRVLLDNTFEPVWLTGAPSIDPATGIITLAGHGLVDGAPIEFNAGTGILPAGIEKYDIDTYGGQYYNVINVGGDGDTFQITVTPGGTIPVIPTDAGQSGWKIRKAILTSVIVGLNLPISNQEKYEVFAIVNGARKSTNPYAIISLSGVNTPYLNFSAGSKYKGTSPSPILDNIAGKYLRLHQHCIISQLSGKLVIESVLSGVASDDKSAGNTSTKSGLAISVEDTQVLNSLYFVSSWTAHLEIRHLRLIIRRVL